MNEHPHAENLNIYTDLCTCNSGKRIIDCCFAKTCSTPPLPKTGYSHPRCYAKSLEDCSSNISKEHYISHSVLSLFESHSVEIRGFSWIKEGTSQRLSKDSLTSKVLCQRHNSALSSLDSIAQKFFSFVLGKNKDQWALIIRGEEIERWMLKAYCGLLSAGVMTYQGKPLPKMEIGPDFLNTLFYQKEIPDGRGFTLVLENKVTFKPGLISWRPLIYEKYGIIGFLFQIEFFKVVLSFGKVSDLDNKTENSKGVRYHPNSIIIKDPDNYREIHLGWPHGQNVTISST
jgi:hypothetical protein